MTAKTNLLNDEAIFIWGIQPIFELFSANNINYIKAIYCLESFGRKKNQKRLLNLIVKKGLSPKRVNNFKQIGLKKDVVHQGICALVEPFWWADKQQLVQLSGSDAILVACDNITDPQNLGAIIRSAHGLGARGIILPHRCCAPITGSVVKASCGAVFKVPIFRIGNLAKELVGLKKLDFWIMGLTPEAKRPIWDIDFLRASVIVVGSEGKGVRALVKKVCDELLSIPLVGNISSLNASVATAIALYESLRQRSLKRG